MNPYKLKVMISENEDGISINSNSLASAGNLDWHFLRRYKIHGGYYEYHCKLNESTRPERAVWVGSNIARALGLEEGQTVELSLCDAEPALKVTLRHFPPNSLKFPELIPGIEILKMGTYQYKGEKLQVISVDREKAFMTGDTAINYEEKPNRSQKSKSSQSAILPEKKPSDISLIGYSEFYEAMKNRVLIPFMKPDLAQGYLRQKLNAVIILRAKGASINRVMNKISEESKAPIFTVSIEDAYSSKSVANYFNEMYNKALQSPSGAIVHIFDSHMIAGLEDKGNAAYSAIFKEIERTINEDNVITIVESPAESETADRFVGTGQFQICVEANPPNQQDREGFIRAFLPINSDCNDEDIQMLAKRMRGYSIIEIQQVLRQAGAQAMIKSAGSSVDEKIIPGLILEQLHVKKMTGSGFGEFEMKTPMKTFDELHGYDELIKKLMLIVDMETGRKEPKYEYKKNPNILLHGPQGTGKSHIAEGCAYYAGCSFFSFSASQIMDKWVGESAKNIRELFKAAREHAPTIIHIDEIDAIVADRENTHTAQVINQLRSEMEGMTSNKGVIVIATTNHIREIDAPILSRFNHQILVDLPDETTLVEIIESILSPIQEVNFNAMDLAKMIPGSSPREIFDIRDAIVHMINTDEKTTIKMADIMDLIGYPTPESLTTILRHRLS